MPIGVILVWRGKYGVTGQGKSTNGSTHEGGDAGGCSHESKDGGLKALYVVLRAVTDVTLVTMLYLLKVVPSGCLVLMTTVLFFL